MELAEGKGSQAQSDSETTGMAGLSDQLADGFAGVLNLQASGWTAPNQLEWQDEQVDEGDDPVHDVSATRALAMAGGVFLAALLPRLIVLFFVTDPQNPGLGWYGDTFHHWQIAYLSKEIGFSEGFLRLWDLKGLEYFWGLLHPLVLAGLFHITGSVDILIPRLLSLISGSLAVAFLFLLSWRYFGGRVAIATALLAGFNPVSLFSDASGMQEPMGMMLLLGGLVLWPKNPAWTGVAWAMAAMVRAEYWVFGAGLVAASLLVEPNGRSKGRLVIGWGAVILLYMKYLLDHTGNPIYPVYWNFMGNAAGAWMENLPIVGEKLIAQWGFRVVAVIAALGAWIILKKKPRHSLLYLMGIGNIILLSLLLGFSAYVRGFLPRFLVDRIFEWPYAFLSLIIAVFLLRQIAPRLRRPWAQLVPWATVAMILAGSQIAWAGIWHYFEPGRQIHATELLAASAIAEKYEGGVISIPEDRPWQTYFLVHEFGMEARWIEGQMYDPFAYMSGDPFADWSRNRSAIKQWLEGRNITLLVFDAGDSRYEELVERERAWFQRLYATPGRRMYIYRVDVQ